MTKELSFEERIKRYRKYIKALNKISFMLSTSRDGTVRVRHGKRYIVVDAADRNCGKRFVGRLEAAIKAEGECISDMLLILEKHCEQLELFNNQEDSNVAEGSGKSEGQFHDTPNEAIRGSEQSA